MSRRLSPELSIILLSSERRFSAPLLTKTFPFMEYGRAVPWVSTDMYSFPSDVLSTLILAITGGSMDSRTLLDMSFKVFFPIIWPMTSPSSLTPKNTRALPELLSMAQIASIASFISAVLSLNSCVSSSLPMFSICSPVLQLILY